ncbi:uncharacterized protein LOC115816385, partial [Chanos chanos]|uniref:Uncharacterized protein LOC115816385 n=1 Tax=Chanos chanos TaxID=29144 RepID=A0A6J2VVJ7_CHACN
VKPETTVYSGETVSLKCVIESGRNWRYKWYKGSTQTAVSQSNGYTITGNTLTIRAAAVTDQDQYWCQGESDDRPTSSQRSNDVTLTVRERPKAVVILQPDKQTFSGETVTLRCQIQGERDTDWEYSWYKKSSSLSPVSKDQEYTISPVSESHSGEYTCRGKHRRDSQSSEISDAVTLAGGFDMRMQCNQEGHICDCNPPATSVAFTPVNLFPNADLSVLPEPYKDLLGVFRTLPALQPPHSHHLPACLHWSSEAQVAFETLKTLFTSSPMLILNILSWLEGAEHPFLMWTDHKNLEYLREAKRLKPRHAKWALFFNLFDFVLRYRPRSKNIKAVELSRQFNSTGLDGVPENTIPTSCIVRQVCLALEEKVVKAQERDPNLEGTPPGCLFVPATIRPEVLLIQQHIWWPSMTQDIQDFIRACPILKAFWSLFTSMSLSSGHHPQSNGQSERVLRCVVLDYLASWSWMLFVTESDSGEYTCRGKQKSDSQNSEMSDGVTLTVFGESLSPPVSLFISPNTTQHFTSDSLSLSCEVQSNSTGWTVRRYTDNGEVSDCSSDWGSVTGSTCSISSLQSSDSGVYWCQSDSGGNSNPLNITVTDGDVILESPVHPVTEGDTLTLHCKYRHDSSDLRADFYKDGLVLQSQTTGEMTIPTLSKSDEGLYWCKHPERGESPKSWITVRAEALTFTHTEATLSLPRLLCSLLVLSPYLLVTIVIGVKCWRAGGESFVNKISQKTEWHQSDFNAGSESDRRRNEGSVRTCVYKTNRPQKDTVYSQVTSNTTTGFVAGPSDVIYTPIVIKQKKNKKKRKDDISTSTVVVYSELKRGMYEKGLQNIRQLI